MKTGILRKLFLGFMQVHILHHAAKEPVYGVWLIEELKRHGYDISAGTLYPLLNNLASWGLLAREEILVNGKIRKYYTATPAGRAVLREAREKAFELVKELSETD